VDNIDVRQGCPTNGPPGCVVQCTATFLNYVYSVQKIKKNIRPLGVGLLFTAFCAAHEPAHNKRCGSLPKILTPLM
jgi:hypothetical protein